jgi:transposase
VGQGRMGVRIASLIAYLRTTLRMPLLLIKEYLYSVHNLSISVGEIVDLLHRIVQDGPLRQAAAAIKERVRKSRVVHGDETGWREGGQNGYVWGFFTPAGERLYEYDHSRGGAVARRIMGADFRGVMSSDFYGGYNDFPGEHQRCWVHLLRDLHELKEKHKGNAEVDEQVIEWAGGVRKLYDDANALLAEHQLGPPTDEEGTQQPYKRQQREAEYRRLVALIREMGERYANAKEHRHHPCHALCKRLLRHQEELFQFVLVSGLSSNNNLAERSIRSVVVTRKISGGTQSPKGSATRMVLASLFGTWRAKGLNPFDQCLSLLSQPSHP